MTEIDILKKLISFRTNKDKYDNEIRNYILGLLRSCFFPFKVIDISNTLKRSFVIKLESNSKKNRPITFLCHLDTVIPSSKWERDPYKAESKGNKITGLGAVDMKGAIACILTVILNLKSLNRDIYLMFTSDEEGLAEDSSKIARKIKLRNALVVAPEPFDNNIGIGQKGVLDLRIDMSGKSSHASLATADFNARNNAIFKMTEVINFIRGQELELSKIKTKDYRASTINYGIIEGGKAINQVADQCSFSFSYRFIPKVNIDEIYIKLKRFINKIDSEAEINILLKGDAFSNELNNDLRKLADFVKKKYKTSQFAMADFWSEIVVYSKNNTCVILGPGESSQAHSSNEYIKISDIKEYIDIFTNIVQNY